MEFCKFSFVCCNSIHNWCNISEWSPQCLMNPGELVLLMPNDCGGSAAYGWSWGGASLAALELWWAEVPLLLLDTWACLCTSTSHSLAGTHLWTKTSYAEDPMLALCTLLKGFPWTSSGVTQRTEYPLWVGGWHLKGIQFDGSRATA